MPKIWDDVEDEDEDLDTDEDDEYVFGTDDLDDFEDDEVNEILRKLEEQGL